MAFVIMASNLRCATGKDDCYNVEPSLIDTAEQEGKMCSERDFTICDMYDLTVKAFPEALETEEAAMNRTGLEFNVYLDPNQPLPNNEFFIKEDGDTCCPTVNYVSYLHKSKQKDVYNATCYIIQRADLRQYFEVGSCQKGEGTCTHCVQHYKIVILLAWCPASWGINKHKFRIPAYCSCQPTP